MTAQLRPNGLTAFRPRDDDLSRIYWAELIVVDLQRNAIVARVRRDETFLSCVGPGSVLETRQLPNGIPQLAVWKVEWVK
jgi:hypothetical protein